MELIKIVRLNFLLLLLLGFSVTGLCQTNIKGDMSKISDKQLFKCFLSQNSTKVENSVREIMLREEKMIPFLVSLKGKKKEFRFILFGNPNAADFYPDVTTNIKVDKNKIVTYEVAALYLISAIYNQKLSFAQTAFLTDLSLPRDKRVPGNSGAIIKKAWISTLDWVKKVDVSGIDKMRKAKIDPLKSGMVAFW